MNTATKTVTMMDLRHNIGAIIDEMLYQNKEIILKRRNKIIGVIMPKTEMSIKNYTTETREQKIDRLFGCMSYLTNKEVEEWIHAGDETDADRAHDEYINSLWKK
ncbi:MAG: hypothetical protein WC801_04615 [Patescibacteria group bacterium]|jgi:hypothetical protein